MTDSANPSVETLEPGDFVIFGGHDFQDGQLRTVWILGPSVVAAFGMQVDNVTITVSQTGFLLIQPKKKEGFTASLGVGADFWARTSELQLVAA